MVSILAIGVVLPSSKRDRGLPPGILLPEKITLITLTHFAGWLSRDTTFWVWPLTGMVALFPPSKAFFQKDHINAVWSILRCLVRHSWPEGRKPKQAKTCSKSLSFLMSSRTTMTEKSGLLGLSVGRNVISPLSIKEAGLRMDLNIGGIPTRTSEKSTEV